MYRNKLGYYLSLLIANIYFSGCDLKFQDATSQVYDEQAIQLTDSFHQKSDPAWSPDGSKIVYSMLIRTTDVSLFSLQGKGTIPFFEIDDDSIELDFTFSPDGRQVCYRSFSRGYLWVYNLDTQVESRLPVPFRSQHPDWSPNANRIVFSAADNTLNYDIWTVSPDGSGLTRITQIDSNALHPAWAPDGNRFAYEAATDSTSAILIADLTSAFNFRQQLAGVDTLPNFEPAWSPNDSTILYYSTRNDTTAIWAYSLIDSSETKVTMMTDESSRPAWSPDGTSFAYVTPEGIVVAAPEGTVLSLTPLSQPNPVWVPVENTLAMTDISENSVIEVVEVGNSSITRVTQRNENFYDFHPTWFPDNNTIAFVRRFGTETEPDDELWIVEYPTGDPAQYLQKTEMMNSINNPAISPDGSLLVFDNSERMFLTLTSDKDVFDLSPFIGVDVREAAWSPNGDGFICNSRGRLKIFKTDSSLVVEETNLPFNYRNPVWSKPHAVFGENIAAETGFNVVVFKAENPTSSRTVVQDGRAPTWSPDGSMIAFEKNGQINMLTILLSLPD